MIMEIVDVTPDQAGIWLDANTRNRSIVTSLVQAYARDMLAGNWLLNGEAVKIARDGFILDGQHRLQAIRTSGVTVRMLVVSDLEPETQKTMDSGRKRTFADNLKIEGVGYGAIAAAVAMRGWMWDTGDRRLIGSVRPTQSEMREWMQKNPSVARSAEIASRSRTAFKPTPQAVAGVAHTLFSRIDQGDTAEFFARFASGAGLDSSDAILTLRNRLIRDAMEKRHSPDAVKLGLFIKAWNAFRADETISGLVMTPDGKMPEPK